MFICALKFKNLVRFFICIMLFLVLSAVVYLTIKSNASILVTETKAGKEIIKWVDFNVNYSAMEKAMELDIKSHGTEGHKYNWIEILAYLGAKYGGNFSNYRAKDIEDLVKKIENGETLEEITNNMKYYNYYLESYTAILGEFVGEYSTQVPDEKGNLVWQDKYGLKAFLPIAAGYPYSHCDDFGVGRSYGFSRRHLGHDFMASIGTPVVAVESGIVEVLGWDEFGGWRIGIRSFDKKRYFYYAHLRKDYPYAEGLIQGTIVKAGDVIGYVGRTGYSLTENTNNINENHLHFGIQLIFDESQKDSANEIWIDIYEIALFLEKNRSKVYKIDVGEYKRVYDFTEESLKKSLTPLENLLLEYKSISGFVFS